MTDLLLAHAHRLAAMLVLLAMSAFFSGSETALFSLSRDLLRRFRQSPRIRERLVPRLLDRPRSLLVTILFGNMMVNVTFFALASGVAWDVGLRYGTAWSGAAGLVALLLVVVFGEVAPKTVAATAPAGVARLAATPLYALRWGLRPVGYVLDHWVIEPFVRVLTGQRSRRGHRLFVTTDELQAIVELASDESVVARDEGEMINEVLQLHDTRVREVMVPRVDMVACDLATPTDRLLDLFRRTKMKKIVVYRDSPDDVCGIVRARDAFLRPGTPLAELVEPVHYVPEQQTVETLLKVFRDRKIQMAIVVDEYGGTAGLVTLEDCIEEIVGDIDDEYARPELPAVRLSDREFLLDGMLGVRAWNDYLQTDLDTEMGVATLGGFVAGLLGRIPQVGDSCRYGNLRFTVKEVTCRPHGGPCGRASKILVEILHGDSGPAMHRTGNARRRGAPPEDRPHG